MANKFKNTQIDVQTIITLKNTFPSENFSKKLPFLTQKKLRRIIFFVYFKEKKTSFSVADGIPLHSKDLLDSPGHGVIQALQVLLGEVGRPQDLDLPDELGQGPSVLALELLLHVIPTIFYWV